MVESVGAVGGPLGAEAPVRVLVGSALAKGATRLQGAVLMVEKGEDDAIHQVRVSCRRLRSDLKLFRKLLAGDWAGELRSDLAALAQACGETRDLEVIAALVRETANSEDDEEHVETILTTLTVGLDRAAARSAEVVLGESTAELLETLEAVAAAPDLKPKAGQALRRGPARAPGRCQPQVHPSGRQAEALDPGRRLARGAPAGEARPVRRRHQRIRTR